MINLKNIKFWIFDLDNTLYSSTTNIFSKIDKKMCQFIIDELRVDESEALKIKNRIKNWSKPDLKIKKGILYKYVKSVSNASNGCVTDE